MWFSVEEERGLTGDGDEESDGGLCCFSSVERNAAVMSRLQEGACLLMTQSPDLHAPPPAPQQPKSSLNSLNLFTASAARHSKSLFFFCFTLTLTVTLSWAGQLLQQKEGKGTGRNNDGIFTNTIDVDFLTANICRVEKLRLREKYCYITKIPKVVVRLLSNTIKENVRDRS